MAASLADLKGNLSTPNNSVQSLYSSPAFLGRCFAALRGHALGLVLGVKGLGGVFSIFRKTSSREGVLAIEKDPLEFIAAYISPLTDKEHAQIGRIAILWGQIELITEDLLVLVTKLSWKELEALQITDKPMGARTMFLNEARARIKNPELEAKLKSFCDAIHETKVQRNHVFHGMWGWRANSLKRTVEPCARRSKDPSAPLKLYQLHALEKKLCRCSRIGHDLAWLLRGDQRRSKHVRFLHYGDKEPPQFLRQWSERNPLDHEVLDQSGKGGKLRRLENLHPLK